MPGGGGAGQFPGTGGGSGSGPGSCVESAEVSSTPMLRLTQEQYANIVKPIFSLRDSPRALLPADENLGPFAVNGVATISTGIALQYRAVAEAIGAEIEGKVATLVPCGAMSTDAQFLACAQTYFTTTAKLLFRRSLTAAELSNWMAVYQSVVSSRAATAAKNHAAGVAAVVEGLLQSPSFLFRVERVPASFSNGPNETFPLDDNALVSRLSFLLWNSGPDQTLLSLADAPEPLTQAALVSQIERMLESPQAKIGFPAFSDAWADLKSLKSDLAAGRDSHGLTPVQMLQLLQENRRFVQSVFLEGDGKLSTLLTAPYTIVSADLAQVIYGTSAAPDPSGRLALNPAERAGLMTNPAVLFSHSHNEVTSPVLRGKWVRETLLCQTVPDPPPDVNITPPVPKPGVSIRETYSQHSTDPACRGCHSLMDPLGFAFESFDEIGRFRTAERGGAPIDSTGTLIGTDVDGAIMNAVELGKRLSTSQLPYQCLAQQTYRYAFGSSPIESETCTIDRLARDAQNEPGGFRAMVKSLVATPAFLVRKPL
jgi:Protein of unknown function (DUF1588)/Protein of unknown function (DUF1592)/Protein of unknown function (DUF1595)/Protein of unknown function (DUF1585)/Protein of unknown function (DUF1587)